MEKQKKEYIAPEIEVIEFNLDERIADGSGQDGGTVSNSIPEIFNTKLFD